MRISDLAGAKIAIWGAGTETVALAEVLAQRSIDCQITCVVLDEPQGNEREAQLAKIAPLLSPEGAAPLLAECDLIVRAPLVSAHREELSALMCR